ncbi:OmpH family outer membrane protein [Algoriphagus sediminis]|uniref:OmpH family outer membrane protein n=1 Tax=Algoriphagus sediminis TaxID=3057113 RepID=A0ABT7YEE2_9BACT|nr:OmpH family outer membrane protein [Algoriphagus sediminis]MDN3204868.1 OmpH family outer membrane protein [Algoriphagus sediminis]
MIKSLRLVVILFCLSFAFKTEAQKLGYVDTEYILNKHPDYKIIQDELEKLGNQWKQQAKELDTEIKELYTQLQAEEVLLTEEMYKSRLAAIQQKEKESQAFNSRIFGINGEYYQKQAELLQPLQSKIYDALEVVSRKNNLGMLFDKASVPTGLIYTDPIHDYSEFVLAELGIEENN